MNSLVLSAAVRREIPLWMRYCLATILVGAGSLCVRMLDLHGVTAPYLLLIPLTMLVSLTLDRGSGLYSAALSSVAYLVLTAPRGSMSGHQPPPDGMAALTSFVLFAGTIGLAAYLVEQLYRNLSAAADSADEKETLLREASHRIKNNLQTIISLLRLQRRGCASAETKAALETALARINVMATVHGRLVGNALSERVDMGQFVFSLCNDLRKSMIGDRPIGFAIEAGAAPVDCSRAVSVGLIVNELITNAVKHGFPGDRAGTIGVSLRRSDDEYLLDVFDDGVGNSSGSVPGLGQTLTQLLARQLGGSIEWGQGPGTRRRLRFPVAASTVRR